MYRPFDHTTEQIQPAAPPLSYGWRETPIGRPDTLHGGVLVPFAQGLIQAFGPAMLVTTGAFGAVMTLGWAWYVPLLIGPAVLFTISSWRTWKFVDNRQELLWQREELERRDIDKDGYIGRPPEVRYHPVYVGRTSTAPPIQQGSIERGNVLRAETDLEDFVNEALQRGLSRRRWNLDNGNHSNIVLKRSGNEITRDYYDALVSILTDAGVVYPGGDGVAHRWTLPDGEVLRVLFGNRPPTV